MCGMNGLKREPGVVLSELVLYVSVACIMARLLFQGFGG